MSLLRSIFSRRTFALASGGTVLAAGGGYWYLNSGPAYPMSTLETRRPPPPWTPPSRKDMLKSLKASGAIKTQGGQGEEFDLLIIGGGATGSGCAVDAASRGLKVALVERDDFGAGMSFKLWFFTTSRADKPLHRNIFEVYKTGSRRSPLPSESRLRARLRPIQTREGGTA